jgi:hypothetical protein
MQTATITELKKELTQLMPSQVLEICLRMARFKKENKELLTYLLFEAQNEEAYIQSIRHELDEEMARVKSGSIYLTKKSLRKVLRQLDKYIRYSANKQTEAELRIYFLRKINETDLPVSRSQVLTNIYNGQLKKIETAVSKLHEDLQYDFGLELEELRQ